MNNLRSVDDLSDVLKHSLELYKDHIGCIIDSSKAFCTYVTIVEDNSMFESKFGNIKSSKIFEDFDDSIVPFLYIGSTSVKSLLNGYKGSVLSKQYKTVWKDAVSNCPDNFVTYVLSYHDDRESTLNAELEIHKDNLVMYHPYFFNKSYAKGIFGLSHTYGLGSKQSIERKLKLKEIHQGKSYGDNLKRSETLKGKMVGGKHYSAKIFKITSPDEQIFIIHGNIAGFCKDHDISSYILLRFLNKGRVRICDLLSTTISQKSKNTISWMIKQLSIGYDTSEETIIDVYDENNIVDDFHIPYAREWFNRSAKSAVGIKGITLNVKTNNYNVSLIINHKHFYIGTFKDLDDAKNAREEFLDDLYKKYPVENDSKYPHVYYVKKYQKYVALYYMDKKKIHVGYFYDPKEAYLAYCNHRGIKPENFD